MTKTLPLPLEKYMEKKRKKLSTFLFVDVFYFSRNFAFKVWNDKKIIKKIHILMYSEWCLIFKLFVIPVISPF